MAAALALLGGGCMSSRYVDRIVRDVVSNKAQSVAESSNTMEDAFAKIEDTNQVPASIAMDLATALRLATQYSRSLQTKRETLYLQGLDTLKVRRQFGPQYAGTLDYVLNWPSDASRNGGGGLGLTASQMLDSGGTLAAKANSTTSFQNGGTNGTADTYRNSAGVSFTQPLYQGAGYEASHELEIQAERQLLYQLRAFAMERQDFAIKMMNSYYGLLTEKANVDNTRTNVSQATFLRRRSEAMFKVRKAKIDDVLRARQNELIASNNLSSVEIGLDVKVSRFLMDLGLPVDTRVSLTGTVPDLRSDALDEETCIRLALDLRLDLMTERERVADAERHVRIAKNAMLPQVDAMGTAGVDGNSDDSLVDQDYENTLSAGVRMVLPLDKRNERDDLRRKKIMLDQSRRALSEKNDGIKVEIIDSFRRLKVQEQTVIMQKENTDLAERNVRATMMRFKNGEVDNLSVVAAQESLLSAKNTYIRELAAYAGQRVQLMRNMGLLDVRAEGTLVELPIPKEQP